MKFNDEGLNAKWLAMLPVFKCHKVVRAGKIGFMAKDEPNGLLMVHCEPSLMPLAVPLDFLQRHAPEIGGYLVVYEDGYLSYSPGEVFEAGYHEIPALGTACGGVGGDAAAAPGSDFSFALRMVKAGKRICRAGWNGKGQYVILIPGEHLARSAGYGFGEAIGEFTFGSVLALKNAQNIMQPGWVPSMGDLMADDWQVVTE